MNASVNVSENVSVNVCVNASVNVSVNATYLAKYSLFLTDVPHIEQRNSLKSEWDRL